MKQIKIWEIEFLLEKAENEVWNKAEKIMLALYWDVGYCLRDCNEKEIAKTSKMLSTMFDVEQNFFVVAYHFYKNNPIKKKAMEVAV
jgi:hypothetical protein